MQNQFTRTQILFGKSAMDTLAGARVAVFGVGGVGGYVAEVLARSGVGELHIFDNDRVCLTNVNRQIYALFSTIGQYKVDVAAERIHDINPHCIVYRYQMFYLPSSADQVDFSQFDYVVDCVDTVSAKIDLACRCYQMQIPIISCMGAANKIDPAAFRVADINQTNVDPLARVLRKKLRELHVPQLKVVYSEEKPLQPLECDAISCLSHTIDSNKEMRKSNQGHSVPASNAFVPAAAGLIVGGEVVKDLLQVAGTMRILPEESDRNEAAQRAAEKAERHHQKFLQMKRDTENGQEPLTRFIIHTPELEEDSFRDFSSEASPEHP